MVHGRVSVALHACGSQVRGQVMTWQPVHFKPLVECVFVSVTCTVNFAIVRVNSPIIYYINFV